MAGLCLGELAGFVETDLNGRIAVVFGRLDLRDRTRTGLDGRDRPDQAALFEDLGHAQLAPQQAFGKGRRHSLISMLTPAGRLSRIRASTVLDVGSRMSISRLCVRISNCSRESLSMNGERKTVYFSICVGRGTGPATT